MNEITIWKTVETIRPNEPVVQRSELMQWSASSVDDALAIIASLEAELLRTDPLINEEKGFYPHPNDNFRFNRLKIIWRVPVFERIRFDYADPSMPVGVRQYHAEARHAG